MNNEKERFLMSLRLFLCSLVFMSVARAEDALPSWADTSPKQAILDFVERVSALNGKDFVPEKDRLAVFDNDGTLWPECPMPFQIAFVLDEVKRLVAEQPELTKDPMIEVAIKGDFEALFAGEKHDGFMKIMALTHSGMTSDEFSRRVKSWFAGAKYPPLGTSYGDATYQPMQEVFDLLRSKGFQVAIVSGGGVDFMRQFSEDVYGVPPEWVLGSSADVVFELQDDVPTFVKQASNLYINDKVGKSVRIYQQLGRRPIACFGNSDGDQSMLEYTTIDNPYTSLGVIVHHTDGVRECEYDKKPPLSGKLITALEEAPKRGWVVVDMKNDWNTVFASPKD
ncbi:haloacid dehalogenase-like hydrolase [Planctomycetaceae bacterium]|nr:haloacid dehalogenase-like hydrolase [Planctomycetaceae bacterium]